MAIGQHERVQKKRGREREREREREIQILRKRVRVRERERKRKRKKRKKMNAIVKVDEIFLLLFDMKTHNNVILPRAYQQNRTK